MQQQHSSRWPEACNGAATAVLLAKTGGGPPGEWRVFIARRPAGSEGLSEREREGAGRRDDRWLEHLL